MIDIKVPTVGESISEVVLVKWLKKQGDYVDRDEVIAELESEKATFEVNAEQAGTLNLVGKEGDTLKIGDVVARIDETASKPESKPESKAASPAAQNKQSRSRLSLLRSRLKQPPSLQPLSQIKKSRLPVSLLLAPEAKYSSMMF
jgi:2-oxoglutarate dehydrogenase E2 component (dihydrolipoamide succinyltransferase)